MVPERLRKLDPAAAAFRSTDGFVLLSPGLQGRIFCAIDGEVVHKLDYELAEHPTESFNNIGGNSFWPAPEGGDFAFNYPHGEWCVQDGINKVCPTLAGSRMVKQISLLNAKGVNVSLEDKREVTPEDISAVSSKYGVKAVSYTSKDTFTALGAYSADQVLLNAWTLEQFWGSDGITAFGKFNKKGASVKEIINDDFYGDPLKRIRFTENLFIFTLGGPDRLQIGVKKACDPEFIGAYDPKKDMLIIRKTSVMPGKYINIADNDQKAGPYSTEDMYSIFNGATLNFFELETIAPMVVKDNCFVASQLVSQTFIYKGTKEALARLLENEYQINAKEIIR